MTAACTARSCGATLAQLLEERGVDVVFGIPGVHTLEIYRGLAGSSIRHITPRHEQGAAFMADGYARVTGRPGVCVLITGPGLTNAATAIASAHHDSQPLLIVSSATATRDAGRGRGPLHDLPDQQALMATITAHSETVSDPAELGPALDRAFAVLAGPRPRPVHIGIPTDILAANAATPVPAATAERAFPRVADDALERAVTLLSGSRQPMILLGGGAVDAGDAAIRIAKAVGAPVVTTINGKGAVPEDDPVAIGAVAGFASTYAALEAADVVLAVGTELSPVDYYDQDDPPRFRGSVIRVDVDPGQLTSGRDPAVALLGDARETLHALASRLGHEHSSTAAARASQLRAELDYGRVPERILKALDAIASALPRDAIVASDSTQLAYVANLYLRVRCSRSYLCPAGFGTLGPALPMAVGAKVAAPTRPVACIVGDGGLLFTVSELATAVQLSLPLAVILWQNHGYGEIRDSMDRVGVPHVGTDATAPDYLSLARGLGCHAVAVQAIEDVSAAVGEAFNGDRPTLIEIPAESA